MIREPKDKGVRCSSTELARLSGATPDHIRYWGRVGLLLKHKDTSSPFLLSELPKAKLMVLFVERLQMKAKKSSSLADDLLADYQDREDAFEAMLAVVDALDRRITELVDLILDLNLVPHLLAVFSKERE